MKTLILNQSNIIADGSNSTMVYRFPNSASFPKGSRIAVSNVTMYYSWLNISSSMQNNTITFNWVDTAATNTYTTYTVTIPDGLYEIEQINSYLQWVFQNAPSLSTSFISPTPSAPMYLVDSSGNNVYYVQLFVNPTAYGIQLDTYNVPTSLPSGYTNPGGMLFPAQSYNSVVTFPSNFNEIVGFATSFASNQNQNNAGSNPGTAKAYKIGSTYSYVSTITPQVQPNPSLLLCVSGIDNKLANPTSVIYSVCPTVGIGQIVVEKPSEFNWSDLTPGTYNEIRLQFLGTDLGNVVIQDPNITVVLVLDDKQA